MGFQWFNIKKMIKSTKKRDLNLGFEKCNTPHITCSNTVTNVEEQARKYVKMQGRLF